MTKFHGRMVLFFTILNSKVPLPLMPHAEFQHTYMNLLYLLLLAMAAFMHQVQFETIGAIFQRSTHLVSCFQLLTVAAERHSTHNGCFDMTIPHYGPLDQVI